MSRLGGLAAAASLVALALLVALAAFLSEQTAAVRVASRPFPAPLSQHFENPALAGRVLVTGFRQPSALTVVQGRLFLLDAGNARVLELGRTGAVVRALGGLQTQGAVALAGDGNYLYVADARDSRILVLTPSGRVVRAIELGAVEPADGPPPRPIGLAVDGRGDLFVSDANSHRVLRLDSQGGVVWAAGRGGRGAGDGAFNTPGGLALDEVANVYVADILNGRVVKLSQDGAFLQQFGRLGDTAGTLSRPKDVAVDRAGNVYVSDSLLTAVQVFDPAGKYLGFIGRQDPHDSHSRSLFQAPAGLEIVGDRLYVVDRFAGIFVFQLPAEQPRPAGLDLQQVD
ncbi:MAG TPA: NHL repeat-containing protein [Dehalococcoidia bacterium]|nr:NHL repeat-containing protein [Dehalococcoidia bacterium]